MLQVHDIRETRVYQEAWEEGFEEGRKEGFEEGLAMVMASMANKLPVAEIAAILELDPEIVQRTLANKP